MKKFSININSILCISDDDPDYNAFTEEHIANALQSALYENLTEEEKIFLPNGVTVNVVQIEGEIP